MKIYDGLVFHQNKNNMFRTIYLLLVIQCFGSFHSAAAENDVLRYAFVVGNQNYQQAPLKHSINDAIAISNELIELGFQVTTVTDTDLATLRKQIKSFYSQISASAESDTLALFYYAGHAIQINQTNYLVPLNVDVKDQQSFFSSLFDISELFSEMRTKQNIQNIVILDACRNNPFGNNLVEATSNGLAPVKAPPQTMIAFATEPGGVASDGGKKNGVYTKHLVRNISENITVEELFKKVRAGVARETRNKQIPWEHSSLLKEIYFNPPKNKDIPDIVVF